MSPLPSSGPRPRGLSILPIFGGSSQVPSPVLVRGAVGRAVGATPERVRAAEAVSSALGELVCEASAGERRPRWDRPVDASEGEMMRRTGLLPGEVRDGLELLLASGTALREGDGVRLDGSVAGDLPCLARVSWPRVRGGLEARGASLAPALAVLREVARRAEPGGAEGGSDWLASSLPGLAESVGYGRTAVSQALSALAAAGFVERGSQRRMTLRLLPRALEGESGEAGASAGLAAPPAADPGALPGGSASAVFGSHPVHLPPGTPLEVEALPGGGSRLRMGPLSVETEPDGTQMLVYGALRIRP